MFKWGPHNAVSHLSGGSDQSWCTSTTSKQRIGSMSLPGAFLFYCVKTFEFRERGPWSSSPSFRPPVRCTKFLIANGIRILIIDTTILLPLWFLAIKTTTVSTFLCRRLNPNDWEDPKWPSPCLIGSYLRSCIHVSTSSPLGVFSDIVAMRKGLVCREWFLDWQSRWSSQYLALGFKESIWFWRWQVWALFC